jgi:hypothetical protein
VSTLRKAQGARNILVQSNSNTFNFVQNINVNVNVQAGKGQLHFVIVILDHIVYAGQRMTA